MAISRALIFLLLMSSGVCFALYAFTSEPRYKRLGWLILKWTLLAALGFFAVLIVLNLIQGAGA